METRPGVSPSNTSGKYVLNRVMSTPHDDVLAAQGVSWLQRTAISFATVHSQSIQTLILQVTLELKHTFTNQPQVETITFQNTTTGGIKGLNQLEYTRGVNEKEPLEFMNSPVTTSSIMIMYSEL